MKSVEDEEYTDPQPSPAGAKMIAAQGPRFHLVLESAWRSADREK